MKKINSIFVVSLNFLLVLSVSSAFASEPLPWQMGLQPPAGSIAEMADNTVGMTKRYVDVTLGAC